MEAIINYIYFLSHEVPLVWFTLLGTILEEVIGPIPSPLVLTTAGSVALSQSRGLLFLFFLALIASIIKTGTAYAVYLVADYSEDIFTSRFGRLFGLTHAQVERIGSKFNGTTRDELILFALRIIPILPAFPISVVCGIVKFPVKSYLLTTLVSNFVKCLGFLLVGYVGVSKFTTLLLIFAHTGKILWGILFILLTLFLMTFVHKYKKPLKKFFSRSSPSLPQ